MSALSPDADFASAASTRSSVFGPSPERSRSCCASAAARSSSTVVIPSSCQSRLAVFGPRPGTRMISTSPSGILSRSFWSAFRSPVSQSSTIFASIVPPIPGICVAVPSSASRATGAADSLIRAAARR